MRADEIVRVLRTVSRGEKVTPLTFEVIYAAADMIESLQGQLLPKVVVGSKEGEDEGNNNN